MTAPQLSVDTVNKSASNNNISQTPETVKENSNKFSISENDSNGNKLTKQQREYFKDSKVVDENGNLLVMYHGTPNANFTKFKSGSYFTQNMNYADNYKSLSASSISVKKSAENPDIYTVYLNITKPFDTRNKKERDIFINEYYRKYGTGAPLSESGLPDWTDGLDLQEFIEEMGYNYDGLILDEGATGGYGDEVVYRGLSYVTFNANQIKNTNNVSPSDSDDIRFSLSEPVEEKDNLIAVHNIYTDKLAKSLKLGGFPMPSIVISKPDMSKVSNIDIEAYKNLSTKEAKKPIRKIAEMLGIHNVNYKNSNIKFDFAFSKSSLDTSLNHQREYGGSYTDYAEMLTCLDNLVENAELIEVHKNYKSNLGLKKTYVLISAFSDKSNVVPVQLEVKNFENQPNGLYLNVILSKIKESAVMTESLLGSKTDSTPLVADSAISLSQLFANVNPSDKRFLKYVPDNFLSTEQIEAKREAQKSDYKNYNRYVEVFENVEKSGSSSKYSESAGKGNVLPDDANQSNSTDNKAVINNNDIRYSLAVDDAQAKKDGRYKKGTNYHGLGATAVKEIYEKLSNPIAVIAADNSKYISQRVIAFADLSINGKQVIAPIEVYAEISQGSDTIDANLIVSYYDKNNISNMLSKALALEANNQVVFYYLDKKRAQSLLVPLGLQLPPNPIMLALISLYVISLLMPIGKLIQF